MFTGLATCVGLKASPVVHARNKPFVFYLCAASVRVLLFAVVVDIGFNDEPRVARFWEGKQRNK
jgi:hypothetical protein